ncbi:MAG TPA: A/G-specific adenine glycosylase [Fastidiosipila sp.]|nr:A/G-specific adenine glycosylase [Fastidiosipila sp.]
MKKHEERLTEAILTLLSTWRFRALPFRENRTPYRVLVAEFMLQQTQTTTMQSYFDRFMKKWPTVEALANAKEEDVYHAFSGLGYYRRAGFLHRTAKQIVAEYDAVVPASVDKLLTLPGIGPYTASAIASIAFAIPVAAVDGNIVRVLSRLLAEPWQRNNQKDLREVKTALELVLQKEDIHAGDVNEALMDLSATTCKPKNPECSLCPIKRYCLAYDTDSIKKYPRPPKTKEKTNVHLTYLILTDATGVYVRRRTESLLRNTYEFIRVEEDHAELIPELEAAKDGGSLVHTFSHRVWHVHFKKADRPFVNVGETDRQLQVGSLTYQHVTFDELSRLPFSSLFKKKIKELLDKHVKQKG